MPKIYLDNCCYNRPFDEQSQDLILLETEAKLIIQSRIKQGLHDLVWSFMLASENDENPSDDKKEAIQSWASIADEYCPASPDVLAEAKEFMQIGLRHKDAIHLACAIKCQCDYLITTDRKFINKNRYVDAIEIINPVTFIFETEECNENG